MILCIRTPNSILSYSIDRLSSGEMYSIKEIDFIAMNSRGTYCNNAKTNLRERFSIVCYIFTMRRTNSVICILFISYKEWNAFFNRQTEAMTTNSDIEFCAFFSANEKIRQNKNEICFQITCAKLLHWWKVVSSWRNIF